MLNQKFKNDKQMEWVTQFLPPKFEQEQVKFLEFNKHEESVQFSKGSMKIGTEASDSIKYTQDIEVSPNAKTKLEAGVLNAVQWACDIMNYENCDKLKESTLLITLEDGCVIAKFEYKPASRAASRFSKLAIAGIVIGSLIPVVIVLFVAFWYFWKTDDELAKETDDEDLSDDDLEQQEKSGSQQQEKNSFSINWPKMGSY